MSLAYRKRRRLRRLLRGKYFAWASGSGCSRLNCADHWIFPTFIAVAGTCHWGSRRGRAGKCIKSIDYDTGVSVIRSYCSSDSIRYSA